MSGSHPHSHSHSHPSQGPAPNPGRPAAPLDPAAQKSKTFVAGLSVVSNSLLVAGKLAVGLMIGSVSVISEAIHSGMDLAASIIALFAVNRSNKPADSEHPFGHGKVENISGTVEALLIFAAAGWIIWEAVKRLIHAHPLEAPGLGFWIMLVSVVLNTVVSRLLFKVARQTGSMALQADAMHLATDVWTSVGVMAGLGLIQSAHWIHERTGIEWLDHLDWLDPVVAIGVALLIIKAAWRLTVDSGRDLLDWSLPAEEQAWMHQYAAQPRPGVMGIHKLRTRKSGNTRFVEFHLIVDRKMSVNAAHDITDDLTAGIMAQYPDTQVTIHVEPATSQRSVDPVITAP